MIRDLLLIVSWIGYWMCNLYHLYCGSPYIFKIKSVRISAFDKRQLLWESSHSFILTFLSQVIYVTIFCFYVKKMFSRKQMHIPNNTHEIKPFCCANQLTGFYMKATLALNGLKTDSHSF